MQATYVGHVAIAPPDRAEVLCVDEQSQVEPRCSLRSTSPPGG